MVCRAAANRRYMEVTLAKEKGFTLIELLIVIAIIGILAVVAMLVMRYYTARAHSAVVVSECHKVYRAFSLFYMDNETYPNATSAPAFNLATFDPLRSQGYYNGNITARLLNGPGRLVRFARRSGLESGILAAAHFGCRSECTFPCRGLRQCPPWRGTTTHRGLRVPQWGPVITLGGRAGFSPGSFISAYASVV